MTVAITSHQEDDEQINVSWILKETKVNGIWYFVSILLAHRRSEFDTKDWNRFFQEKSITKKKKKKFQVKSELGMKVLYWLK